MDAVSQKVQEVSADMSKKEADDYVEIAFLTIIVLISFTVFYMLTKLFCSCCCRKRSKLKSEDTKPEEPVMSDTKSGKSSKSASKSKSTPKRAKKGKQRK